jgi:TorA maturation chaperone TorD
MAARCRADPATRRPVESPDEIDLARSQEYSLLSSLLLRQPDAPLLESLARLTGDGTELGRAHAALAAAAADADPAAVAQEHFTLFTGLGRGELLPYSSYYLTGFVQGRPLADLREMLLRLGLERAPGQTEPEDHAAILLDLMAGLTGGWLEAPAGTDRELFETHISPWMGRFFADLARSPQARFYASVGTLGLTFLSIEQRGFALLQPDG